MKRFLSVFLFSLFALLAISIPRNVSANEGILNLRGSGSSGACFASSVFIDGTYKILMSCRELKIALSPEKNRYVAWAETEDGTQRRLGEVVNGKLQTSTDLKFIRIFVSVETDTYGNTPSGDILLTGFVEPISFGPGITSTPILTPTPTPTKAEKAAAAPTAVKEAGEATENGLGKALGTIFRIALLGFGVLLLIVGVFSFISRRRSL